MEDRYIYLKVSCKAPKDYTPGLSRSISFTLTSWFCGDLPHHVNTQVMG